MNEVSELGKRLSGQSPDPTQLASILRRTGQTDLVRAMLEQVCSQERLLERCAEVSQRHPLGFDKYVLHADNYCQLRIHVWWPQLRRGREDVHNHRFDFCSRVLVGTLQVEHYSDNDQGEAMVEFREDHTKGQGSYVFDQVGPRSVRNASTAVLSAGSINYTTADVLHRVGTVGDGLAATLFLKWPVPGRTSTSVLVPNASAPPPRTASTLLDIREVRHRLNELLVLLP